MKSARYGGIPVPVPDIPGSISGLGRFAAQVQRSIRALRDRPVVIPANNVPPIPRHPWQARANGDDTVNINAGTVMSWTTTVSGTAPNEPFTMSTTTYAGDDVTVTAAGTIQLVIDTNSQITSDDTFMWSFVYTVGTMTVEFNPSPTGDEVHIPICAVDLTDGVASVTAQYLDHNPLLDLGWAIDQGV